MNKTNTKYWFYLNSDTFVWKSNDKVLLYNTFLQESLTFKNNKSLEKMLNHLQDMKNLYCVELSSSEVNNNDLISFVKGTLNSKFGHIEKAKKGERKPACFIPILKLQNRIKKIDHFVKENQNMLSYLHKLDIYLDEKTKNESKFTITTGIPFHDFFKFLNSFINCSSLSTISIHCDNLLQYPFIEHLIDEINKTPIAKELYLTSECFDKSFDFFSSWKSKPDKIILIIEPTIKDQQLLSLIEKINFFSLPIEWQFKVTSEQDYGIADNFIKSNQIKNVEITPFFDGTNHNFFKEFVYLTENNILDSKLTKREIFTHQAINTNHFGKLSVTADGRVYANLYQPPLGTINDPINEMLCKELNSNSSWLRIRDQEPCNECIYKWLCPSPSNYEFLIGKPNLCHVYP
jgi:pseudo-rSAM protein